MSGIKRAWITKADGAKVYIEGDQAHIDTNLELHGGTAEYVDQRPDFKRVTSVRPEPADYAVARQEAYPSVGDQLDMFWRYIANPDDPEVKAMAGKIAAIKATHLKP